MPKFRKKPVVIEAMQYHLNSGFAINEWSGGIAVESPALEPSEENPSGQYLQIKTLEGVMIGNIGDWIICGVNGEFYPCKPDIFQKTYEPAD